VSYRFTSSISASIWRIVNFMIRTEAVTEIPLRVYSFRTSVLIMNAPLHRQHFVATAGVTWIDPSPRKKEVKRHARTASASAQSSLLSSEYST
jgi:hypothetical protein